MIKRKHIIGLVFLALALCFAFSPTVWTPAASAQMDMQESGVSEGGGGKAAGDPDMPDTQPPPTGTDSRSGAYGSYSGTSTFGLAPRDGSALGSGSAGDLSLRIYWLQSLWQALRLQFGWF